MRRILLSAPLLIVLSLAPFVLASDASATTTIAPLTCNGLTPTIVSNLGEDEVIYGTGGADVIIVTFLNGGPNGFGGSTVYGQGGHDTICVHSFYTTVFGGGGNDWISGNGPDGFSPPPKTRFTQPLAKGQVPNMGEGLFGDSGADYIESAELIDGGSGNDDLYDAFEIFGGSGNDLMEDADFCDGGSGTDTATDCCETIRAENVVDPDPPCFR